MQQFRTCEPVLRLDLRTEVTENDDSRHFRPHQDRSDQELEVLQPLRIT